VSIAERVAALDVSLFEAIETQTEIDDRRSLLALHDAAAERDSFEYLEIGSHVGGSLQALIRDPRCRRIVSVDSRPASQPDQRGPSFAYPGNTTARMLESLARIEGADLAKLETFDAATADLDPAAMGEPDLLFVDGEHTDEAALADARWCRAVLGDRGGAIAFHDSWIVHRAISRFLGELEGVEHSAHLLPESIVLVELGPPRLSSAAGVRGRADLAAHAYLAGLERQAYFRDAYFARGRLSRLLRR